MTSASFSPTDAHCLAPKKRRDHEGPARHDEREVRNLFPLPRYLTNLELIGVERTSRTCTLCFLRIRNTAVQGELEQIVFVKKHLFVKNRERPQDAAKRSACNLLLIALMLVPGSTQHCASALWMAKSHCLFWRTCVGRLVTGRSHEASRAVKQI
jgi:hypothetical protein